MHIVAIEQKVYGTYIEKLERGNRWSEREKITE